MDPKMKAAYRLMLTREKFTAFMRNEVEHLYKYKTDKFTHRTNTIVISERTWDSIRHIELK